MARDLLKLISEMDTMDDGEDATLVEDEEIDELLYPQLFVHEE